MSALLRGFSDELEKLGGALGALRALRKFFIGKPASMGKVMTRVVLPASLVAAGAKGVAERGNVAKRAIAATAAGPSQAWATNYSQALGIPRRQSKLEDAAESINFSRWRARQ